MALFGRGSDEPKGTIHAYRSGSRNAFDWTWDKGTNEVRIGVIVEQMDGPFKKKKLQQVLCGKAISPKEAKDIAQCWVNSHPDAEALVD
jgi:hypothetical protein